MSFLPMTTEEMRERGWKQADFVLITGDAYVDHPSFGTAIISRVWKAAAIRSLSWHSRTGERRMISRDSESRGLDF
jgi:hypothetical protein